MELLPNWDRQRLRTSPPQDVAAARLTVFVQQVKPVLVRDFAGELDDLRDRTPEQQKLHDRKRKAQNTESLKDALKLQAALRKQLGLDDA